MKYLQLHMYMLCATIIVAGSFIASGIVSGVINPFSLNLFRFVLAALVLLPFILIKKSYRSMVLKTMPRALVISFFYSMYFVCLFESLNTTTVLNTGTLFTLVPFITALLSWGLLKEKISIKKCFVYAIAISGTIWVIFKADINLLFSFSLNFGDYLFLLGAFSMCCYAVCMKILYRNDEMMVLVFAILLGGLFWSALILYWNNQALQWHLIKDEIAYSMIYLSIAATLITTYLSQKATIDLGPNKVISYFYLNPAFVAILLYFIEGIHIELIVIPGIVLSMIATTILQKDKSQPTN